jgi:hypothetical protein
MKAKEIQRVIDALSWERNALFDRYSLAVARQERLGTAAIAYDKATIETQAPEECKRLDRMIELETKARRLADRLAARRDLVMGACSNLEHALDLVPKRMKV